MTNCGRGQDIKDSEKERTEQVGPQSSNLHTLAFKLLEHQRLELASDAWTLARELGCGAYGVVDRIRYRGKDVALKDFRSKRNALPDALSEVTAYAALGAHPSIVGLLDAGLLEDASHDKGAGVSDPCLNDRKERKSPRVGLVFELAQESLREYILREKGGQSEVISRELTEDVARGLAHMHMHQLVHTDVKPGNVLIFRAPERKCDAGSASIDGLRAKLADLGVATPPSTEYAREQSPIGTLEYRAPEHRESAGKFEITPAVDSWALGLCLWELALGEVEVLARGKPEAFPDLLAVIAKKSFPEKLTNALAARGLALLECLLQTDPASRMSVKAALAHDFFHPTAFVLATAGKFAATRSDVAVREGWIEPAILRLMLEERRGMDPAKLGVAALLAEGSAECPPLPPSITLEDRDPETGRRTKALYHAKMSRDCGTSSMCGQALGKDLLPSRCTQVWRDIFSDGVNAKAVHGDLGSKVQKGLRELPPNKLQKNGRHAMTTPVKKWFNATAQGQMKFRGRARGRARSPGRCSDSSNAAPCSVGSKRKHSSKQQQEEDDLLPLLKRSRCEPLHFDGSPSLAHMGITEAGERDIKCWSQQPSTRDRGKTWFRSKRHLPDPGNAFKMSRVICIRFVAHGANLTLAV